MSPSSRRAWIEIYLNLPVRELMEVALLTEGVDRNAMLPSSIFSKIVALLMEGVDRNIIGVIAALFALAVALLAEGVDRNSMSPSLQTCTTCRPPHGGRG